MKAMGVTGLFVMIASCGGTAIIGERSGGSAGEEGITPGTTGGSGGVIPFEGGGSGGGYSGGGTGASSGTGGTSSAGTAGSTGGGSGGIPNWSINLTPGPVPGEAGAPHADLRIHSLATRPDGTTALAAEVYDDGMSALPCAQSPEGEDGLVLAFNLDGTIKFCQSVVSPGDDAARGVEFGSEGDVSFAGRTDGPATIGSTSLVNNGEADLVLGRLSAGGDVDWVRSFGYEGVQEANGITRSESDDIYVVGGFEGTILSGADVLIGVGSRSAFALKLDAEGAWQWGRSWGQGWATALRVAPAAGGGVIVAGTFDGPIELGSEQYVGAGAPDGFLIHLSASGEVLWSRVFGNMATQRPTDLAVSASGAIALTGRTSGPLDFGDGEQDPGEGVFVVVYNANGELSWSRQLPVGVDGELESKPGVVFDDQGNVIVTGAFEGQVDFGMGLLTSAGGTDVFIASWSPGGDPRFSYRYGGAEAQVARAISYRASVGLTVAGVFFGTVDFGDGPLTSSPNGASAFLVRFPE